MQASLAKPLNGFVRHATVELTSRRPLGNMGNECLPARNEIFIC